MDLCHSNLTEEWRPIPGYEGLYEASNMGRVRSSPGKVTSNQRFEKRIWQSRVMKPKYPRAKKRQDGRLSLWKDGKSKDYLVSRLVASAWLGIPADGMTVNHIDGNYNNNSVDNLEWVTLRENIQKGFEDGLFNSFMRRVKLKTESGECFFFKSMSEASMWLGMNRGYISNIIAKGKAIATSRDGKKYTITPF